MEDLDKQNTVVEVNIFEQAKKAHKQEIIAAYQEGFNNAYFNNPLSKEQYYNENFNK
jgi:hypothetical protein